MKHRLRAFLFNLGLKKFHHYIVVSTTLLAIYIVLRHTRTQIINTNVHAPIPLFPKDIESEILSVGIPQPIKKNLFWKRQKSNVLLLRDTLFHSDTILDSFILARVGVTCKSYDEIIEEISDGVIETNFFLLVVADMGTFMTEPRVRREIILRFCKENKKGMLMFAPFSKTMEITEKGDVFGLGMKNIRGIQSFELETRSDIWYVTRPGKIDNSSDHADWTSFHFNVEYSRNFRPLIYAKVKDSEMRYVVALEDLGLDDGIRKIVIGRNLSPEAWFLHLLFIDSLKHLTGGLIDINLDRYLLVDIENVFMKMDGHSKVSKEDANAILQIQTFLKAYIKDFKFSLGFIGSYFGKGSEISVQADNSFLVNKHEFWWFPQFWTNRQTHLLTTLKSVKEELQQNQQFAEEHRLPITPHYVVPPQESGVYPAVNILYDALTESGAEAITSTTLYHFPNSVIDFHSGFYHSGTVILPRIKLIDFEDKDGGAQNTSRRIYGGELFLQMIYNKVQIIRTTCQDFTGERPAIYTLHNLLSFLRRWTNLKLISEEPYQLSRRYFHLYPEDMHTTYWQNPCLNSDMKSKWPPSYSQNCHSLPFPDAVIIGPQKTGTSALRTFLSVHPSVRMNLPHPETFDETHFFNEHSKYEEGIEWYLSRFPPRKSDQDTFIEKSANYYHSKEVPAKMRTLLPNAKIIIILLEPTRRSQSHYYQYQHHGDNGTSAYSIKEFFMEDNVSKDAIQTRRIILRDSTYVFHLEKWLAYFPGRQLIFVDGTKLVENPIAVMNDLQNDLGLQPKIDFSARIGFNNSKGFFCPLNPDDSNTQCLGGSKGRHYPDLDPETETYLREYFRPRNTKLARLLHRLEKPLPEWLLEYDEP